MTHGRPEEAERVVAGIEARVEKETGRPLPPVPEQHLRLRTDVHSWFGAGFKALVTQYRQRTFLGVVLMAAQAFCYNAVFFTYALILTTLLQSSAGSVGPVHLALCRRQLSRPAAARPIVRHDRPPANDHRHLRHLRHPDGNHRLPVRGRRPFARRSDRRLDSDLLFRLRCGEFRLSDCRRELPAGSPSRGDRAVLRIRYGAGRRDRARAVRRADPKRIARLHHVGISARRRADAAGRCRPLRSLRCRPSAARWKKSPGRCRRPDQSRPGIFARS